jgi:hypothetical protein
MMRLKEQTTELLPNWHPMSTLRAGERGIDRRWGLAVISPEHIDLQRDARIGVPEALADRHDVHAGVDELQGVRVPHAVKCHARLLFMTAKQISDIPGIGKASAGENNRYRTKYLR